MSKASEFLIADGWELEKVKRVDPRLWKWTDPLTGDEMLTDEALKRWRTRRFAEKLNERLDKQLEERLSDAHS